MTATPLLPPANHDPLGGELIVVNFCGLGGACRGIEHALGVRVHHAINHNPTMVSLHRRNNPDSTHHVQDVWQVNPRTLTRGQRIALAWFSPDCRHFSRAKGGKPVSQSVRDLAWVTTHYSGLPEGEKPRLIILENVSEWSTWGPLDAQGRLDPARKGETFRAFIAALEADGYTVAWRILDAADYGAPTHRQRLILLARCDSQPLVWPEPTHGDPASPEVQRGERLPWRSAAECLNFSLPTRSLLDRPGDPLAAATLYRVAVGISKYLQGKADVFLTPGAGETLSAPFLIQYNGQSTAKDVTHPLPTVTTKDRFGLVMPVLTPQGQLTGVQQQRAEQVYALACQHAPARLSGAEHAARQVQVRAGGQEHVVTDLGTRMLRPRELARAQSFDDGYVINEDDSGQRVPHRDQVAGLGNSVCPKLAAAVVAAQFPASVPNAAD